MKKTEDLFAELMEIICTLRGPYGCPWDRKQTPENVKAYLVEELYELLEAIDMDEEKMLVEETGDILFMIMFLVNLYEQKKGFSLNDVLNTVIKKMKHRHPHVFGDKTVNSADEVMENWQMLKEQEGKKAKNSILDGIPGNLPALSHSFFITSKASKVGFDWQIPEEVLKKLKEETEELEAALTEGQKGKIAEETGDILFSIVNLSRHLGIDPEQALRKANTKFIRRFNHIETELKKQGREIKKTPLEELDRLWEEAKILDRED